MSRRNLQEPEALLRWEPASGPQAAAVRMLADLRSREHVCHLVLTATRGVYDDYLSGRFFRRRA